MAATAHDKLQRKMVKAVLARWPGIDVQASAAGAWLKQGAWAGRLQKLNGVHAGFPDIQVCERGRQGEPGFFAEVKPPGAPGLSPAQHAGIAKLSHCSRGLQVHSGAQHQAAACPPGAVLATRLYCLGAVRRWHRAAAHAAISAATRAARTRVVREECPGGYTVGLPLVLATHVRVRVLLLCTLMTGFGAQRGHRGRRGQGQHGRRGAAYEAWACRLCSDHCLA